MTLQIRPEKPGGLRDTHYQISIVLADATLLANHFIDTRNKYFQLITVFTEINPNNNTLDRKPAKC